MKKIIFITLLFSVLITSSAAAAQVQPGATPEFGSAVETYIAGAIIVHRHEKSGAELAYKILHALTVEDRSLDEIYIFIHEETAGDPPDIFDPYYAGYVP